jgi:hypothetical protein
MAKFVMVKETEPLYEKEGVPASQSEIGAALSWYHANRNEKDAAKYLSCDLKVAKNHTTYAWTVRLRQRGFLFSEETEKNVSILKDKFESALLDAGKLVEMFDEDGNVLTNNKVVINLQERISSKTDEYIGELEGMIDQYGFGEDSENFNAYDWFVKNEVKPMHASKIIDHFRNRASVLLSALEDKDKEYVKAHTSLGKNKIKNILTVMANIVKDAERLAQNVNKSRKPRKKKAVNFQKLAAKVKFKEKDDSFKIQSIDPINIIGASQAWVFNVKTKRLAVYTAADDAGLFLKGTTITSFSNENSYAKTLRKPEKVLNNVLNGGKLVLRKLMSEITGKNFPVNGRINTDTIILRALK